MLVLQVNQMEFHPFYQEKKVLKYCADHDIHVTAYSSLGTTPYKGEVNELLTCSEVKEAAKKCGVTPAKVLLRWALDKGHSIVPKSTDPGHIALNAQVMDFVYKDEAEKILDDLSKRKTKFAWDPKDVC